MTALEQLNSNQPFRNRSSIVRIVRIKLRHPTSMPSDGFLAGPSFPLFCDVPRILHLFIYSFEFGLGCPLLAPLLLPAAHVPCLAGAVLLEGVEEGSCRLVGFVAVSVWA